ncbi:MAG: hypothetical protein QOH29_1077, partial [Actinomycetota bacterium]|nr:hypothetical protein [Actinomycetota bacterium]
MIANDREALRWQYNELTPVEDVGPPA